ncbi:MAG: porin [Alphaproteobacteria bacterium]|nr:porin [Alphaproteobacteria bacterium]
MKKILLGSTALIAAGMIAGGTAQAEDKPIAVSVGGYYQTAFGVIDENTESDEYSDHRNSSSFGQDLEINVDGSSTFDNGLTVGFHSAITGNNASADGSDTMDERFVYFGSNWGQIRVGATESARQNNVTFAPGATNIFGVNTPFFVFGNPGNGQGIYNVSTWDDGLGQEDSNKIVYFSPNFNGFSFAASYAPGDARAGQYGGNTRDVSGQLLDQAGLGAGFDTALGDAKLHISAAYESYNTDRCGATMIAHNCDDSPKSWNLGGKLSIGKISIGGGYLDADIMANGTAATGQSIGSSRNQTNYDAGVSYSDAGWSVALQYGQKVQDGLDMLDETFSIVALNGSYAIGPGVQIAAQVDRGTFEDDTAGSNRDNEYTTLMFGTSLSF